YCVVMGELVVRPDQLTILVAPALRLVERSQRSYEPAGGKLLGLTVRRNIEQVGNDDHVWRTGLCVDGGGHRSGQNCPARKRHTGVGKRGTRVRRRRVD